MGNSVELLPGTLDMLILKAVSLRPLHGYAVLQRIRQISGEVFDIPQGSLYPALHRLEQNGWIDSEWKDTELGRSAKFYALTREGKQQLEREVDSWNRLSSAVGLVLKKA